MSALGMWLQRWQPVAIHGAMLVGAKPEAVAGALGSSLEVAFGRWHEWALGQRDFIANGKPGITAEEYERVARRFALAARTSNSVGSHWGVVGGG